jgi:NAD(P)-dependent dehydrogenase (short-subunit alcohol dehydrogenase family)
MTKAAIDNFVKVAALELADRSIRVNSIRPGMIQTPMILKERAYTSAFIAQEIVKYKLGPGKPDDVAALVKFLISDSGRWLTGQNITLDGGRSLSS